MPKSETTKAEYAKIAQQIMITIVRTHDEFTADAFYEVANSYKMPPDLIKRFSGSFFRKFQAAGYIKKTNYYRLSARNSRPLPVWIKAEGQ